MCVAAMGREPRRVDRALVTGLLFVAVGVSGFVRYASNGNPSYVLVGIGFLVGGLAVLTFWSGWRPRWVSRMRHHPTPGEGAHFQGATEPEHGP